MTEIGHYKYYCQVGGNQGMLGAPTGGRVSGWSGRCGGGYPVSVLLRLSKSVGVRDTCGFGEGRRIFAAGCGHLCSRDTFRREKNGHDESAVSDYRSELSKNQAG
jgi:hypothetical protein